MSWMFSGSDMGDKPQVRVPVCEVGHGRRTRVLMHALEPPPALLFLASQAGAAGIQGCLLRLSEASLIALFTICSVKAVEPSIPPS